MKFRGDIQGARGIGVLIILLAHVGVSQLHGGYVLVDLFFAVSGFVITAMLIAEHKHRLSQGQHGFSLLGFYLRRLKRIFPIATVGIVTTVLLAYLVWNQVAAKKVFSDGIWAFFSLANFHEISKATDYFAQNVSHSPLQHYWTLAVEEQFYLLWPLLMLIALRLAGRTRDWRTLGLLVITPVFITSLAYSIYFSSQNPTAAYFSTFTHAWELAAGAMLAFACEYPRFVAWFTPPLRVSVIFISGWVVVLGTAFVLPAGISYPGAVALIPILATLAVLACGAADGSGVMSLVDNKLLRYFGDISFSLYVFHWPVVVFTKILLPTLAPGILKVVQVSVAVAVAALAYAFIERPLRGLVIGIPQAARADFRAKRRELERATRKQAVRALAWTVGASLCAAVVMSQAPNLGDTSGKAASTKIVKAEVKHWQTTKRGIPTGMQTQYPADTNLDEISGAQQTLALPSNQSGTGSGVQALNNGKALTNKVNPAWFESWKRASFEWKRDSWSCLPETVDICGVGSTDAKFRVLVAGDSHAYQFADGLKLWAAANPDLQVILAARQNCPFSTNPTIQYPQSAQNTKQNQAACAELRRALVGRLLNSGAFTLAIISDATGSLVSSRSDGVGRTAAISALRKNFISSTQVLKRSAKSIVLWDTIVGWQNPAECLNRDLSNWVDCSKRPASLDQTQASYASLAKSAGVEVYHLSSALCTPKLCPLFLGKLAVTPDGGHISQEMGAALMPVLVPRIETLLRR